MSHALIFFIFQDSAAEFLVTGTVIGFLQWGLVLRNQLYRAGRWVWISIIGWAVGWFLGMAAQVWIATPIAIVALDVNVGNAELDYGSGFWTIAVWLIVQGAMIGTAQRWFILEEEFNGAGWWILATTVSWPLGSWLGWVLIGPVELGSNEWLIGSSAVHGMTFGAITGFVLVWFLRQSHSSG